MDLRVNKIKDTSKLVGLHNLRILTLCRNKIVDVTPLSKLVELQELDVSINFIEDISSFISL